MFQRIDRFWKWTSAVDLILTNLAILIADVIAIHPGMKFFDALLGAQWSAQSSPFDCRGVSSPLSRGGKRNHPPYRLAHRSSTSSALSPSLSICDQR